MVSTIITNYQRDITELVSQLKNEQCEVVVVDNDNLSLSGKRNYGIFRSKGEFIYFIDDDNLIRPGAVVALERVMLDYPEFGILASVAVTRDGRRVDYGSFRSLITGFTWNVDEYTRWVWEPQFVPYRVDEAANAFMVRREVFEKIGGFDSQRFPMDMDEADLCLRARKAGYLVGYFPGSVVYHEACPTVPKFRRKKSAYYVGRNRFLFQRKHLGGKFLVFLVLFAPVFVMVYVLSLVLHGQIGFVPAFLKGVVDGLFNRFNRSPGY